MQVAGRPERPSVVVAMADPLSRLGIELLLATSANDVSATSVFETSGLVEVLETQAPSVLVIDTRFGQVNGNRGDAFRNHGLKTVSWVRGRYPWLPVIVVARMPTEREMFEAMRVGCVAYLHRSTGEEALVNAVTDASEFRFTFSAGIVARPGIGVAVQRVTRSQTSHISPEARASSPTTRELDVVGLVSRGRSNKAIASELQVSDQTVKNYVTVILRKLGVTDRTQAVVQAMRLGWISP